jgi:hypothetical protein
MAVSWSRAVVRVYLATVDLVEELLVGYLWWDVDDSDGAVQIIWATGILEYVSRDISFVSSMLMSTF